MFSAQDAQGNWYALKRQLAADREAADAIIQEIKFLKAVRVFVTSFRLLQATLVQSTKQLLDFLYPADPGVVSTQWPVAGLLLSA